jgi:hypothetical protein
MRKNKVDVSLKRKIVRNKLVLFRGMIKRNLLYTNYNNNKNNNNNSNSNNNNNTLTKP